MTDTEVTSRRQAFIDHETEEHLWKVLKDYSTINRNTPRTSSR